MQLKKCSWERQVSKSTEHCKPKLMAIGPFISQHFMKQRQTELEEFKKKKLESPSHKIFFLTMTNVILN